MPKRYAAKQIRKKALPTPKNAPKSSPTADVAPQNFDQLPSDQQMLILQRSVGNQALMKLMGKSDAIVQRAFRPARVTSKAHLRNANAGAIDVDNMVGRAIPKGAEVVIDSTDTIVQHRKVISNATWVRAVDTTAANWDPALDPTHGGYIRQASTNPALPAYPRPAQLTLGSRGTLDVQTDWHEDYGEYLVVEKSAQTPADDIVKIGATFYRMNAAHQCFPLTALEKTQVDDVSRDSAVTARITLIMNQAAAAAGISPAVFASAHNIQNLKKPLRMELAKGNQKEKNQWYKWSQNVLAKIAQGASELADSILHWRSQIYPGNPALAIPTIIEVEGSDLHDKGLGAVFVTYTKPNDATGMFPNVPLVKVVIKPEDRNIEKSLFGTQAGSLANQINNLAGLGVGDSITRIKMETHANYGSIIEFVQGQQAKAINGTGVGTQAMSEGIAFAFLAGMSDVHKENVIWNNGKPYFIDADNSLNAARLNNVESQSGFSFNNKAQTDTDVDHIQNNPNQSRSAIIQAVIQDSIPFIQAIRAAFTNKQGRVVPIYTNHWAKNLRHYVPRDDGTPADDIQHVFTRWSVINMLAAQVQSGGPDGIGTGLEGESGTAGGGGHFDLAAEKLQIKADFDQGKIPFYNYDYSTGNVTHNGQVIWQGQNLDDAMNILLAKFPPPLPIGLLDDND